MYRLDIIKNITRREVRLTKSQQTVSFLEHFLGKFQETKSFFVLALGGTGFRVDFRHVVDLQRALYAVFQVLGYNVERQLKEIDSESCGNSLTVVSIASGYKVFMCTR